MMIVGRKKKSIHHQKHDVAGNGLATAAQFQYRFVHFTYSGSVSH